MRNRLRGWFKSLGGSIKAVAWLSAFLFFLSYTASIAYSEVPHKIHYQGRITMTNNGPVPPGLYKITIRLYNSETGGTPLWEEVHQIELDRTGYFHLTLGENTPLNLDFTQPYWMSVEINDDGEMEPRIPLLSVGYSINTETLDGLDSLQFLRSDVDDVMEANLTIQGQTTMQSTLTFSGPSVDITAKDGENLRMKASENADVIIDITASSSNFKLVGPSGDLVTVDNTGNVVISGEDNTKVVKIHPGNLLVGDSAPSGYFDGGDLYVTGDLYVDGAVNFSSGGTGGDALTIDVDHQEAFLVRKDNDNGDVFVVNTIDSKVEVSSGTDSSPSTRKSIIFRHDGTDGFIETNQGDLRINPDGGTVRILTNAVVSNNLQVLGQTQLVYGGGDALIVSQTGTGKSIVSTGGLVKIGSNTPTHLGVDDDGSQVNDLYVQGDMEVDGSVWLGDATSDNLTVTGTFNLAGDMNMNGDLDMQSHRIYNIGTNNSEFLADGSLTLHGTLSVDGLVTLYNNISLPNATSIDLKDGEVNALDFESGLLHLDTQNRYIGINTANPSAMLELFGSGNKIKLSYDASNYAELYTTSSGELRITSAGSSSSVLELGGGSADAIITLLGDDVNAYYLAHEVDSDELRLGSGTDPESSVYLSMNSSGLFKFSQALGIGLYPASGTKLHISGGNLRLDSGSVYLTSAGSHLGIGVSSTALGLQLGAGSPSVSGSTDAYIDGTLEAHSGAIMGGQVDMSSNKIVNLADPTDLQDAATKNYVDNTVNSTVNSSVSGTQNYLAKFTDTNAVGDSVIYQDPSTNNIGIKTTTPSVELDVSGSVHASGSAQIDGNAQVTGDLTVGSTSSPSKVVVRGSAVSGDRVLEIYSGYDLVAWVRKK